VPTSAETSVGVISLDVVVSSISAIVSSRVSLDASRSASSPPHPQASAMNKQPSGARYGWRTGMLASSGGKPSVPLDVVRTRPHVNACPRPWPGTGAPDEPGGQRGHEANRKLSRQRADAVVKALVDAGVVADRLEVEGYGPERPVCAGRRTAASRCA